MTDSDPPGRILWGVGTSRTLRALWILAELDLPYEHRRIASRSGETLTREYTQLNPSQRTSARGSATNSMLLS
jgi:glutathione S-transferase